MNNKKIEKITVELDRVENETKNELEKLNNDRAQIAAKIAELEAKKEKAESLEKFKTISEALKAENENLLFIDNNINRIKAGTLDNNTAKEYQEIIIDSLTDFQNSSASEIQKTFFELIALMNNYADEYARGVALLERVKNLNNKKVKVSARCEAWTISECNKDPAEWWNNFCYFYFRYYSEALRKTK